MRPCIHACCIAPACAARRPKQRFLPRQRKWHALCVEFIDGLVDRPVEFVSVVKGLMRQMIGLEVVPDHFDVVAFGPILGQPLDGEPVRAGGKCCQRELAGVDRTIVLDEHHRLGGLPWPGTIETVELLNMGDEVAAALGRAGVDDELARDVIERPQHRDLLGLPWCRHTQIRPQLRPCAGKIGMRQRLALVAKEERCPRLRPDVCATAGAGRPGRSLRRSGAPSACAAAAANGTFFRNTLDSSERLMRTPARASISARSRGIVQLRRSATGCSSKGVATRNAVSLFTGTGTGPGTGTGTGTGPGATLAFSASIPPPANSLRQRRTVSRRTPNASAMRGLAQPASVSRTVRALSASPRSREPASLASAAHCSSVAVSGDFPAMSRTCQSVPEENRSHIRWSTYRILLSTNCTRWGRY